jgi:hypothetical protein
MRGDPIKGATMGGTEIDAEIAEEVELCARQAGDR